MKDTFCFLKIIFAAASLLEVTACNGVSVGASGGSGGTGLSLGTSFSANKQNAPETIEYRDLVKSIVQHNLRWDGGKVGQASALRFHLNKSGDITEIKQRSSSGNEGFDQAAVSALEQSSPLPVPPQSVLKSFDYMQILVEGPK